MDEDYLNGRTACSAAGSVLNAVATLGIQTYTITGASRTSGVVTVNATNSILYIGSCVFGSPYCGGPQIEIQNGTTGQSSFEGAFTATSASGSAITFNQYGVSDASGTVTSGNLRVVGMVAVKWQAPTAYTVLKHLIYRCTGASCTLPANAANYNLVGVATGQDSYFLDRGYTVSAANIDNGDAPQTAPTTTSNGWLATTISSGGGTTTLTLAASSTNAVSGVAVKHDNAPVIKAACAAIPANTGAPILFAPATPGAGAYNYAPFSSFFAISGTGLPASVTANCPGGTEIDFQSMLWLNAPMQLGHWLTMRGGAGGAITSPSGYFEAPTTLITGYAYPMIYINGQSSTNDFMAQFKVTCNQSYQTCLYEDESSNGDGPTDFRYDDVYLVNTSGYSNAYVAKSGFGRFWTRGIWQTSANDFSSPTAALFTMNCGTGQSGPNWPSIGYTNYTSIYGGLLIDGCGVNSNAFGHWNFTELLTESGYIPAIRVNTAGYGAGFSALNLSYADILGGFSTPAIDLTNASGSAITVTNPACANGFQPLFEVGTSGYYPGLQVVGQPCAYLGANNGTVTYETGAYANLSDQLGWNTRLQNTSHVAYQMALPAAPASAVAVAGATLSIGPHTYQLTAVDADGNETLVGPSVTVTTTSGNQNVTVTAPATFPAGAVGVNVYRDSGMINPGGASCSMPQITTPGGTITDNYYYRCSSNTPYLNQAGSSLLSSGGLSTYKLHLGSEALTASPRGEQNIFLPSALTSTWTGSTWTPDKAVTVTRVQVQAKTAPAGCSTNAVVRLTDGTSPINITISGSANDSGVIAQNYAAATPLTFSVQTAAAGCTTSPADANVTVQYRMQ